MKSTEQIKLNPTANQTFSEACRATCQKLIGLIQNAKEAIFIEFRARREAHEHLLRLALTEAEALAWETAYPHLVFPALAREKAQAIATWDARQRFIRRTNRALPIAA